MKGRPRFYKPVSGTPLEICYQEHTVGVSRNGDIILKVFPSKCSNHSKQINKAAFLDSFVARGREPQIASASGSSACFASLPACQPRSAQADRLCNNLLLANPQALPGR